MAALVNASSAGEPEVKLSADELVVGRLGQWELTTLPVELLKPIFQTAANESFETAFSLVHVSSAVNKWVAPSLYRIVHLRTEHSARLFRRTTESLDSSWLATHVQFLVFYYRMGYVEDIGPILAACSGITGISHELQWPPPLSFVRPLAELTESCTRLTHLAIRLNDITARDAKFPRTLTHLSVELIQAALTDHVLFWTLHDDCPRLAHIGINLHSPPLVDPKQMFEALAWISRYVHRSPLRLRLIVVNLILPNIVPQAVRNTLSWHRSWYTYCSPNWPKLAAVYSDGTTMYNPLDMDLEDDSPAIAFHDDTSISWLKDEVWQAAEAVMQWQRDFMDMDTVP
ncbi:hypothetical protein BDZ89DRAFT_283205 [Hymenopellis radicata]|nr:hypothetical protein BDZ89DRAFT_283205 [Hymenopellis radicata]